MRLGANLHVDKRIINVTAIYEYGLTYFELINAKISCKCRKKVRLPLHTVVLVFSVQSEGKLVSVLDEFVAFEFLRCR